MTRDESIEVATAGRPRGPLVLAGCLLLVGAWLVSPGLMGPAPAREASRGIARPAINSLDLADSASVRLSKPIEAIRVGDRVLADNPGLDDTGDGDEPNPETWWEVHLRLTKPDGSPLDVVLLREFEWVQEYGASVGGRVFLDIEEMGAVGEAEVVSLGPCPAIEPSRGGRSRVVTGTFRHVSDRLVELFVTGQPDPIEVTDNHPFWSEDRRQFVPVGTLRPDERLRTIDGREARVVRVADRPGASVVYNLEVYGEHVYYVGSRGLLVHNHCVYRAVVEGMTKYVGITNTFIRRAGEHLRLYGRIIEQVRGLENITYKQARAVEHLLIQKYGRIKDRMGKLLGGQLENLQGGIDPRKLGKYTKELKWAAKKIEELGL